MVKASIMKTRGWFATAKRPGDRTLDQQMTGLDQLLSEVSGKTVIDAGCAEGLISVEMLNAGATYCIGIEIVDSHVQIARELTSGMDCDIIQANLNNYDVSQLPPADVVLLLAILHKLKDPSAVCSAFADLAKDLCVIRLPPSGPIIVDDRSGGVPHDISAVMQGRGFTLESVVAGPLTEWLGYFRRRHDLEHVADSAMLDIDLEQAAPETNVNDDDTPTNPEPPLPSPPTEPAPEDQITVEGEKVEGGQQLFPTEQRRGRRSQAKVKPDDAEPEGQ